MTDTTSQRLDCIKYLAHQILNACSLIDLIYFPSVGHIFILFTSLKVKKVFTIHGFDFRYILLDEKFTSFIKEPHNEYNNIVTVGSRVSQRDKYYFNLPGISLDHLYI